ncbi:MAG: ABC transporter permease [Bacteroidetes bacterium]|nr:MAG: ABC transporter permease [Bacteroidota bacterium]
MNTLVVLAWRNIWRNKRRTWITAASIFFAVLLSTLMVSIQKGAWDRMEESVVNYYFGYVQIHSQGYWEDQSIDRAFVEADSLRRLIESIPGVEATVPRLESFALAAHGERTIGVMAVGMDPEREHALTRLRERLVQGRYVDDTDEAVLVAEGVARRLDIQAGDTLVLLSQGYHGVNAAGKYVVQGLIHFGSPELNRQMVYLPLPVARYFYGADGLITSLALKVTDKDDVPRIRATLQQRLDTTRYEVMDWQEMMPELVEARAVDTAGNYLMLLILYLIVSFGIFGTILMMTAERMYEFGVLVAIGMRRLQLSVEVWLEVLFIALLGTLLGFLASFPLVYYFHRHPIDLSGSPEMAETYAQFGFEPVFPAAFEPMVFLGQAIVVFAITSLLALYPFWKIGRLQPVTAMHH